MGPELHPCSLFHRNAVSRSFGGHFDDLKLALPPKHHSRLSVTDLERASEQLAPHRPSK
jgi:hypothetical protein